MGVVGWIALGLGVVVLFLIVQAIWLAIVLTWGNEQTKGLGYYGQSPEGRARFKQKLRTQARWLFPILRLIGRTSRFTFEKASFRHEGTTGPRGTCSEQSFAHAVAYEARADDIFVVTQMKCGTTWMQHIVYEILHRGRGSIVESGGTLYAVSPWIEALKGVPIDDAPLHGTERASRIIKTHLPAHLCPFSRDARYIYVARHPVSCFASCNDFVGTNVGALAPPLSVVEAWFCSDDMWWGSWPAHVAGWWTRSQEERNVLFVHFEEMRRDLAGTVRRVSDFLGVTPLTDQEVAEVVRKCSFDYMQQHKDHFEMHPPHILQTDAELFVRGTADRHRDVPAEVRARVAAWTATAMRTSSYPLTARYPDVVAT
ncbi:MAG: sulfotransferase domain-containing protein [Gemmatimonadetes bacterium]|nr:sulfotransferase domain-containing protein [Gemmatimonadota bacterium]